jgi:hypothetical protein
MHKPANDAGILARAFLIYLEASEETRPVVIDQLRTTFFAGAAAVVTTIDDAGSPVDATQAMLLMRAEIDIWREEPP